MSEGIHVSRKQLLILLGGVLLMSFLGVVAGINFVQLKTAKAIRNYELILKKGDFFPDYTFESLTKDSVNIRKLLTGKKSIVMFFTSDCSHCVQTIARWDSVLDNIASEYHVVGISYEPLEKLKSYKLNYNTEIPFYRDPNRTFTGKYRIHDYPTLMGVDEKGKIAFVELGNRSEKTVEDYLKLL